MNNTKYLAEIDGRILKMKQQEFTDVHEFNYEIKQTKAKLRTLFGKPVARGTLNKRLREMSKLTDHLALMRSDLEVLRQEILVGNKENGGSL